MGFRFQGVCYPTKDHAITAWLESYPHMSGGYFLHVNTASISDAGVITWNISVRPLSSATSTAFTATGGTALSSCTASSGFEVDTGGAMFAAGFIPVILMWMFGRVCRGLLASVGLERYAR